MQKRGTLFLNPRSGIADAERATAIRQAATERDLETIEVKPGVDIPALVRERLKAGVELFIAAGGDGTIHSVAQAIVGTHARMAIIPAGTINHLAKDLDIPLDWKPALDLAVSGDVKQIDVGEVNGVYFTNILLLGVYPDMVRERERLRHWYGKSRAYLRAIYKAIRRFHFVTIMVETPQKSQVIRTPVFAVAVNRYEFDSPGIVAPKASFEEGQLAVYWLPEGGRAAVTKTILKFVGGRLQLGRDLKNLYTTEVTVQSRHPRLRLGMNGELVTMETPLQIRIVPRGLGIVVPHRSSGSDSENPR